MMMSFGFAIQGDLKADWQAGGGHEGAGNALLRYVSAVPDRGFSEMGRLRRH